jgi:PAS domain-containing protein
VPDLKKDEWDADAQTILTRGGYQAIEWIDPAGRAVWTTPPGAGDATPDGNAAFEPRRQAAFEAARQSRELAATRTVDLVTGGKGMLVVVPVFTGDQLAGYVAGVFRYRLLFQNLLASNPVPSLAIAVWDGGEPVFAQGFPSRSARLHHEMETTVGGVAWKLEIGPTEALVVQAHSPAGGALLVAGVFLSVLFSLMVYLVQRSGAHPVLDRAMAAAPAPGVSSADALPVVSYNRDGSPAAWNEAAKLLFGGAPPPVSACETGFRTIQATLLRAGASPGGIEALGALLGSCAQPALVFDAEGRFATANPAAAQTLGWSDALWGGRSFGTAAGAGRDALEIRNVLLMQGQWAVPAPVSAAAAHSAR